jgi:hypothetical protein
VPTFVVLAHTDPPMLRRLVDALSPHPVVVHVDAHADPAPFLDLPRTVYVPDRVPVNWGGFSIVEATLRAFTRALPLTRPDDHVVLLSGQCYPSRPVGEFEQFLAEAPFRQHCRAATVFDGTTQSDHRLAQRWCFDALPLRRSRGVSRRAISGARKALARTSTRRTESDFLPLVPVAGSQWIALTGECLADLLPGASDSALKRTFRHALAPDEIYFHTLVYNSRWISETAVPRLEPRGGRLTSEFSNFHWLDTFLQRMPTEDDLEDIARSGAYFVRKVSSSGSRPLLDRLDVLNGRQDATSPTTPDGHPS